MPRALGRSVKMSSSGSRAVMIVSRTDRALSESALVRKRIGGQVADDRQQRARNAEQCRVTAGDSSAAAECRCPSGDVAHCSSDSLKELDPVTRQLEVLHREAVRGSLRAALAALR